MGSRKATGTEWRRGSRRGHRCAGDTREVLSLSFHRSWLLVVTDEAEGGELGHKCRDENTG